ncbi:MAG: ABC transporter substrate-binding protein [Blautia marasmi]
MAAGEKEKSCKNRVIAPVAAAAMVLAVPTGIRRRWCGRKSHSAWTGHRIPTTPALCSTGKGYYEEAGLDVEIVQPPENGAALMCSRWAQFAIRN